MIRSITKYAVSPEAKYDFTILIPTWNNLALLQLCIASIQKHSLQNNQIIVVVNEGKDGTLEWLKAQNNIDFIHAEQNAGICYGLNATRSLFKSDHILYINDDMYVLPGWDKVLYEEIKKIGHAAFYLSATMIEPDEGNPCTVFGNYGRSVDTFQEENLVNNHQSLKRDDWSGGTWPPSVMHIDMWDLVGGYSVEFSPGMYSDPDLSKKLYDAGVRIFKGMGRSLVYHFGSKSTKRIRQNTGRTTFLLKWGLTANEFSQKHLLSGQKNPVPLADKKIQSNHFKHKIKRMIAIWKS